MRVFHEPIKDFAKSVKRAFVPEKPEIPKAATAEGDRVAEVKAAKEAGRRSRAAAVGTGRRDSVLAGESAGRGLQKPLKTILGP
jgi:predicted outer membrane protein